jgi:hypothetical protein
MVYSTGTAHENKYNSTKTFIFFSKKCNRVLSGKFYFVLSGSTGPDLFLDSGMYIHEVFLTTSSSQTAKGNVTVALTYENRQIPPPLHTVAGSELTLMERAILLAGTGRSERYSETTRLESLVCISFRVLIFSNFVHCE